MYQVIGFSRFASAAHKAAELDLFDGEVKLTTADGDVVASHRQLTTDPDGDLLVYVSGSPGDYVYVSSIVSIEGDMPY